MLPVTYTDEEVERAYEEFYEDVHTEFLKFGEIINFKVCRNASSHLRGNVYVHYKSLDSAVLAYESVNGRYFAGKQVQCEFVGVTRWKVAICGEFMKSKLKNCSRGSTCNFIHCFRNPGGEYEWADWDKPPPKYWVKEMAALFGYPDESKHDERTEQGSPRSLRNFSVRSQSEFSRNYCDDDLRSSQPRRHHRSYNREELDYEERDDISKFSEKRQRGNGSIDHDSDKDRHRKRKLASRGGSTDDATGPDENMHDTDMDAYHHECSRRSRRNTEKHGSKQLSGSASIDHDSDKDGLRKIKLASRGGSSDEEAGRDEIMHDTNTDTCHHEHSRRRRHTEKHGSKGDERIERQRERSPRSDVSDHKRNNSSLWDHSDRGSGEVEHDSRGSRRSYRSSKHHSRNDRRRAERGVHDETKPHNRIDERDRWAPDEGYSAV